MLPSLKEGEFVVINRLAYIFGSPERGDIIVFKFPLDPNRRYIKRVIGLTGDSIHVRDGKVFINGEPLVEPYIAGPSRYDGDYTVGEGELFVMGDNRSNSLDSRNWGNLPLDHVIGRAELVYWPPTAVGLIPHYEVVSAGSD
jgi:signal peptidase I